MKPERQYKEFQLLYNELVTEHSDDFANMEWIEEPELVINALRYFQQQSFPLIYPAKSYAVAIIYAALIEQTYGFEIQSTLDDPDLFLGHDDFFVRYSDDPDTYDEILLRLKEIPDWLNSGWAPKTADYFRLECTAEGIEETINNLQE